MATVAELIEQLSKIQDKSQTVVFQYYLAENFLIDCDGDDCEPSEDLFAEAVELVEDYIWDGCWEDLASEISHLHTLQQVIVERQKSAAKTCRCTDCKCDSKNKAAN